jgi:hypothetical protein
VEFNFGKIEMKQKCGIDNFGKVVTETVEFNFGKIEIINKWNSILEKLI